MSKKTMVLGSIGIFGLMFCMWSFVGAGELDPPGSPASTMKTLDEVEPRIAVGEDTTPGDATATYIISTPGSYYLTEDLFSLGKHGILINADHVTLDLMGYRIWSSYSTANPPANTDFDGIYIHDNGEDIEIRNGIVYSDDTSGTEGFRHGIFSRFDFSPATASRYVRIFHMRVFNSRQNGIITNGSFNTVQHCHSIHNDGSGIACNYGVVTDCVSYGNGGIGISAGASVICRNYSGSNGSYGISAADNSVVSENKVSSNSGDGIYAVEGNTIFNNSVYQNYGNGIRGSYANTIRDNTIVKNYLDGILMASDCRIANNTCDSNGYSTNDGAGIHTTSTDNRIEGNQVTDSDRGIDVDSSGSLIVKNSASGNTTNYDIAASNKVGTISTDPTTAGPWDNFSF